MRGKLRYRLIKAGMFPVNVFVLLLMMFFPIMLSAQESDDSQDTDDPSIESDWYDDFYTDLYVKGDQVFVISLGTIFPGIFGSNIKIETPQFSPPVGGVGSLSYNYYLNSKLFIGGELSGFFIHTLRKNTLFVVPLGARIGTQFVIKRFEFPLFFTMGMAWHTYRDFGYYGFFMKTGAGAYFRPMHEWSFGITASWGWYPQWIKKANGAYSIDGSFVNLMLSARYHF